MSEINIKTYSTNDISTNTAISFADFFNIGFSVTPYFHFALHPNSPLTSLPPETNFEAWQETLCINEKSTRLKKQGALLKKAQAHTKSWYSMEELSKISLPSSFYRWTDKEKCRNETINRLRDPGYVTIVRSTQNYGLLGILHARKGTLKRIFQTEEWYNPCLFSTYENIELISHKLTFFEKIHYHFNISSSDEIMTISAQLIHPSLRNGKVFYNMMNSMAKHISEEHAALPLICEIPPSGTAHELNVTFTERIAFDILENGHPLVMCKKASSALEHFLKDRHHWKETLISSIKKRKGLI